MLNISLLHHEILVKLHANILKVINYTIAM